MRLAREGYGWNMAIIEDTDHTARDFGSLIPEIKGYTRDLVPGMNINPRERVAIMRKGGGIRIKDYSRGQPPTNVTFGLAWDITRGRNIDLDASAICLDENLQVLDTVYFKQLRSRDGSIWHSGDEREGDEKGDDEKISVNLPAVHPSVKYIGFTINSYSGQELDDVSKAKCHLFDTHSRVDFASYNMTNCSALDGYTGLLLACLYRETPTEWNLRIIGEPAHGRQAHQLHDNFQNFLHRVPPPPPSIPPEPEIIVNAMPEFVPMQEEGDIVVGPSVPGGAPSAPVAGNGVAMSVPKPY
jgi:stress response protein SCP2